MAINAAFVRMELVRIFGKYRLIRDCLSGSEAVKEAGERYLPKPNAHDKSEENKERYKAYKKRAVFYNVTARTLVGMVGEVFKRPPIVEIPDDMDMIKMDATGSGIPLDMLAKQCLAQGLAYGRGGIFIDYPSTDGEVSRADLAAGRIRPMMTLCTPGTIVNWRTAQIGAETVLTLVVIAELWPFYDDGFEIKTGCKLRVLQLDTVDGAGNPLPQPQYKITTFREPDPSEWSGWVDDEGMFKQKDYTIQEGPFYPTDASGNTLDRIPFEFFGSANNDTNLDQPPMYDMAELNIAHYRNSADYEESCYIQGQPTYWFSGLTQEWMTDVLKGKIELGSMGGVPLPTGAQAGLLQAGSNTMPKEAMEHKEDQMKALGAKLIEKAAGGSRTATEAQQDRSSEQSVLTTVTQNVSSAITRALMWCGIYNGDWSTFQDALDVKYQLSTDFDIGKMSAQDLQQLVATWQAGGIAFEEMRQVLQGAGIATLDLDEARAAIATEEQTRMNQAAAAMAAQQPHVGTPEPSPAPSAAQ